MTEAGPQKTNPHWHYENNDAKIINPLLTGDAPDIWASGDLPDGPLLKNIDAIENAGDAIETLVKTIQRAKYEVHARIDDIINRHVVAALRIELKGTRLGARIEEDSGAFRIRVEPATFACEAAEWELPSTLETSLDALVESALSEWRPEGRSRATALIAAELLRVAKKLEPAPCL